MMDSWSVLVFDASGSGGAGSVLLGGLPAVIVAAWVDSPGSEEAADAGTVRLGR